MKKRQIKKATEKTKAKSKKKEKERQKKEEKNIDVFRAQNVQY